MKSLEFLAARLGKSVAHFVDDEKQVRQRRERDLALVRANQLIAQGAARQAIDELTKVDSEHLSTHEKLALRRTLGRAYIEAGKPGRAAATLSDVVRGFESVNDSEQAARARAQLGAALISLMDYDEAEEHLQRALKASASGLIRDPLFRVHVLYNLGVVFYQRGDYRSALEHFDRSAQEGSDVADPKWLASLYAAMGMARREVGDLEGAISWLLKSEVLFESIKNEARVAEIKLQTARALWALGNHGRAREVFEEALTTASAAGNDVLALRVETQIAWADTREGKHEVALQRLERLIPRAEALDDATAQFGVRYALARTLVEVDPPKAVAALKDLVRGLEQRGASSELADAYNELSKVLGRQGLAEEALTYSQRAFATRTRAKKGGV
ncbi:MAG: tetratricopeptide repeat protein [Chloroflexi bacterium]|nr:tetratricopeptide repeat protein [Chloroflexota bacterium]